MADNRIHNLHIQKRLDKAIEYKTNLKKMNIDENIIPTLKEFSFVLNTWVKDGKYVKNKINIYEIGRKLDYQLSTPKYTYIKFIALV